MSPGGPKGRSLGWACQQGGPTSPALPPVWEEVYLPKSPGHGGCPPTSGEQCGGRRDRKVKPPSEHVCTRQVQLPGVTYSFQDSPLPTSRAGAQMPPSSHSLPYPIILAASGLTRPAPRGVLGHPHRGSPGTKTLGVAGTRGVVPSPAPYPGKALQLCSPDPWWGIEPSSLFL